MSKKKEIKTAHCAFFVTNTGLSWLKRDSANTGGIHSFPLSILFSYFSVNMKMDEINIEIRAKRDMIFAVRFRPL